MTRVTRRFPCALLSLIATSTLLTSSAEASEVEGCLPNIGTREPVILVHGFNGDRDVWGDEASGLWSEINTTPDFYAEAFDYEDYNREWVTHPEIGTKLAERIACMAQSSREQGGNGKVVAIGHSMGGLAIRQAASLESGDYSVADDIGLVLTLGTPYEGSGLANTVRALADICQWGSERLGQACLAVPPDALVGLQINSDAINQLPDFPEEVPVVALAGDVTLGYNYFGATPSWETDGDLVVGVESALESAHSIDQEGGEEEIGCTQHILSAFDASCWHGNLTADEEIESLIIHHLEQHAASYREIVTFEGLSFPLPEGFEPLEQDSPLAIAAFVNNDSCMDTRGVEICDRIVLGGASENTALLESFRPCGTEVVTPSTGSINIDGIESDMRTYSCSDGVQAITIFASHLGITATGDPQVYEEVFSTATWE